MGGCSFSKSNIALFRGFVNHNYFKWLKKYTDIQVLLSDHLGHLFLFASGWLLVGMPFYPLQSP